MAAQYVLYWRAAEAQKHACFTIHHQYIGLLEKGCWVAD